MTAPIGQPVQQCTGCGAGLTLEDLRRENCPYCQVVLPHKAQAQQGAALINEMWGTDANRDGIPDAFEGVIAGATSGQGPYGQPLHHVMATQQHEAMRTAKRITGAVLVTVVVVTVLSLVFTFALVATLL